MNLVKHSNRRTSMAAVAILAVALLGVSCDDGGGSSCPAGSENCPCNTGDVCDGTLVCDAGTCKPDTCPAGTMDCPCDAGACQGTLVCEADVCVEPSCPEGSAGCPCYANNTCDGTLTCNNGTCEDPGCPAGTLGCPCDAGSCQGNLQCNNNVCEDPGCPVGTEGCPCDAGTCQGGLVCSNDVCQAATEGVQVSSAEVRSCDLLFDAGAIAIGVIDFADTVIGGSRKDKTRVAVTFTAKADAALAAPVAFIRATDGSLADVSAITPTSVDCYDRKGAKIDNPGLTLR